MKITFQQTGNQLTLRSESTKDAVTIGQLHARVRSAHLQTSEHSVELTVDAHDLIELAAKK